MKKLLLKKIFPKVLSHNNNTISFLFFHPWKSCIIACRCCCCSHWNWLAAIAVLVLIGFGGFSSMVLILTLLLDGKKKRLGKKRLLYHAHRSSIRCFVLTCGLTYFFIASACVNTLVVHHCWCCWSHDGMCFDVGTNFLHEEMQMDIMLFSIESLICFCHFCCCCCQALHVHMSLLLLTIAAAGDCCCCCSTIAVADDHTLVLVMDIFDLIAVNVSRCVSCIWDVPWLFYNLLLCVRFWSTEEK